jgi:hypothetical protein
VVMMEEMVTVGWLLPLRDEETQQFHSIAIARVWDWVLCLFEGIKVSRGRATRESCQSCRQRGRRKLDDRFWSGKGERLVFWNN